jgi:hypothetical protein
VAAPLDLRVKPLEEGVEVSSLKSAGTEASTSPAEFRRTISRFSWDIASSVSPDT